MTKQLSVRFYGKEIGILEEISGKMHFTYREDAEFQLSLSLPLRPKTFTERECKGYFGGLLPEGEIRKQLAQKHRISANSDFALLAAIGKECAGAVSFYAYGEPEINEITEIKADWLSKEELDEHIKNLPRTPMSSRKLSLAGVQTKTAVCVLDGKIGLPQEGAPSTHILKPAHPQIQEMVINEYLCMKTASEMGLNAPDVAWAQTQTQEYFLIERYDRLIMREEIFRLHQEDFTQARGWNKNKYLFNVKNCFEVLDQTAFPALEKEAFIKEFIFNFLIGNCDAHGKNYSVLYSPDGIVLAPAYDIVCTRAYGAEYDEVFAMEIGNEKIMERVTANDWKKFAKTLGVSPDIVVDELKTQANTIPATLERLCKELDKEIGYKILEFSAQNCENIIKKYKL